MKRVVVAATNFGTCFDHDFGPKTFPKSVTQTGGSCSYI